MNTSFKSIITSYIAILASFIFFYFFGVYNTEQELFDVNSKDLYSIATPFLLYLLGEAIKKYLMRKNFFKSDNTKSETFKNAYLIKWSIIEAGGFVAIFSESLTSLVFLIYVAILLLSYPSYKNYKKYVDDYHL